MELSLWVRTKLLDALPPARATTIHGAVRPVAAHMQGAMTPNGPREDAHTDVMPCARVTLAV